MTCIVSSEALNSIHSLTSATANAPPVFCPFQLHAVRYGRAACHCLTLWLGLTLISLQWAASFKYVPVPPWFSARVPDIFVAVRFRYTYSPVTSLCFVFWPDGATDYSLHHRWTVFPVSSSIHVECSVSFCSFFHISVTVQKSTQDRTIRAFIPAMLLNLSLRLWLDIFVPWSLSLDLRHVNDDSNTN